MNKHKPIPAHVSPETRAIIERLRKSGDELKAVVDAQKEDFEELKKKDPFEDIMGQILLRDRELVRGTDQFSEEVIAEDKLLEEQEARWAEEDKQEKK